MIERIAISDRVDRYIRGLLGESETADFEAELLESRELQDALEVALGLQRAVEIAQHRPTAEIIPLRPGLPLPEAPRRRPQWALAASIAVAGVTVAMFWRSELENAELHERVAQLEQPAESVLTVPLDVMRSLATGSPDVRIRKPAGSALLVLDVEIAAQMAGATELELELTDSNGEPLMQWSMAPEADSRLQVALRTDRLPDGALMLHISDAETGRADSRLIELLPAL